MSIRFPSSQRETKKRKPLRSLRLCGEKVPKFTYKAINETGSTISGTIEADSAEKAGVLLSGKGLIPSNITEAKKGSGGSGSMSFKERTTKVKIPDLILFTKQFRTLLRAGVSIVRIFEVLEEQTENVRLKRVVGMLGQDIKDGLPLYDSFKKQGAVFSDLYCSMIQAGESSGALSEVLDRLTYLIEHEHKVKSQIKSALQYPIIVLIFLAIAFFVLLTFVIPKFIQIFEKAKIDLPLPTVICNIMYHFVADYWYLLLGGAIGIVVVVRLYFKTAQGRLVMDTYVLKLPLFGPLFVKSAMSRFASIFAILQSSGIGVLDAMKILAGTMGNVAISKQFDRLRERLEEGLGISGPLKTARYFTPMVINMVAIGEETGNLDEMLRQIAIHYDEEVEYATNRLSELIGPILMIGLAAVVGFFALAIFMPMWDLTKMVK